MRLLFIKLKHIGDTLILTPTLTAARSLYPDAQIWVVVRKGCESILNGCPAVDRVLTTAHTEHDKRSYADWLQWLQLVRELRAQSFDYVFELSDGDRGRVLALASGAKMRCANNAYQRLNRFWQNCFHGISHFKWHSRHSVERDFYSVSEFLPLGNDIPGLVFSSDRTETWPVAEQIGSFAMMHPASRWQRNRWPVEKWIQVGQWLLERVDNLIVTAGPSCEEIELAANIRNALGHRCISSEGKLNWAQMAWLFYRTKLLVVGDTAAMHLASACQSPVVSLFRPCMTANFHPWETECEVVSDPEFVPVGNRLPTEMADRQTIAEIPVDNVLEACERILKRTQYCSYQHH